MKTPNLKLHTNRILMLGLILAVAFGGGPARAYAAKQSSASSAAEASEPKTTEPGSISMGPEPVLWDPFAEMNRIQQEMSRIFQHFASERPAGFMAPMYASPASRAGFSPDFDWAEYPDHYVMSVDLPGMEKDQIDIQAAGSMLSISGKRERSSERQEDGADGAYYYSSRSFGSFYHSFELPADADESQIDAGYDNGVLTVTVQKLEASKVKQGRKIAVN